MSILDQIDAANSEANFQSLRDECRLRVDGTYTMQWLCGKGWNETIVHAVLDCFEAHCGGWWNWHQLTGAYFVYCYSRIPEVRTAVSNKSNKRRRKADAWLFDSRWSSSEAIRQMRAQIGEVSAKSQRDLNVAAVTAIVAHVYEEFGIIPKIKTLKERKAAFASAKVERAAEKGRKDAERNRKLEQQRLERIANEAIIAEKERKRQEQIEARREIAKEARRIKREAEKQKHLADAAEQETKAACAPPVDSTKLVKTALDDLKELRASGSTPSFYAGGYPSAFYQIIEHLATKTQIDRDGNLPPWGLSDFRPAFDELVAVGAMACSPYPKLLDAAWSAVVAHRSRTTT